MPKHENDPPLTDYERTFALATKHLGQVADWALDVAADLSCDDEDDLEAIENVRDYVHGLIIGKRPRLPLRELLLVIATLFSALEIDAPVQCPGGERDDDPTVRTRQFPGRRRNACGAGAYLAA